MKRKPSIVTVSNSEFRRISVLEGTEHKVFPTFDRIGLYPRSFRGQVLREGVDKRCNSLFECHFTDERTFFLKAIEHGIKYLITNF